MLVSWTWPIGFGSEQAFGQSLPGERAKPKDSPEERTRKKQDREQRQREMQESRKANFGMIPEDDQSPLANEYREAYRNFQEAASVLSHVVVRNSLRTAAIENAPNSLGEEWLDSIKLTNERLVQWRSKGAELFASDPDKSRPIGESLREMMLADVKLDRFDHWLEAAKVLVESGGMSSEKTLVAAGYVGYANNDYDFAARCWGPLAANKKLDWRETHYFGEIERMKEKWTRELAFREKDKAHDNNPLVEMTTTKGRIVIELFEDNAPEAVKNFIYLVEHGFYSRKAFFRVENRICAQTGCEKGDGTGSAGYTIGGEGELPDHRDHFRGSVAIALGNSTLTKRLDLDSGGSQFYFSFLPLPHLDGQHAVFGRIVEGIEVMNFFRVMNLMEEEQRKDPSNRPDLIVSSKIIRKRDHDYRPTPVTGRLPR